MSVAALHKKSQKSRVEVYLGRLSFRMKTVLQSTKEARRSNVTPFLETREEDNAALRYHVKPPPHVHCGADQHESHEVDRQRNQVERLFPEFFTYTSKSHAAECYSIGMSLNQKPEHRLNDPLIQSWLNMYGCN
ncbi:uncharacterized protein LOC144652701 [Oculina patagonica]